MPFLLAWKGPEACLKVSGPLCLHLLYFVFEHTFDFVAFSMFSYVRGPLMQLFISDLCIYSKEMGNGGEVT